ncbi:MAG: T9SS type A sorting domain-containing protein, partial [Bacteroidia bacterium]
DALARKYETVSLNKENMNRFLIGIVLILGALPSLVIAQTNKIPCYTDEVMADLRAENPELFDRNRALDDDAYVKYLQKAESDITNTRANCDVYIIPVVFHMIYASNNSNLSEAAVQVQVAAMNNNYRKIPNTAGYGDGVDTRIQFALATKDPQGNPTNGITRNANATLGNHSSIGVGSAPLTNFIYWQNCINIYVVTDIITSSTPPPGSFVAGYTNTPDQNIQNRGIVLHYLGIDVTGSTVTHEVGHWLGLFHPFLNGGNFSGNKLCAGNSGTSCETAGDRVCDTQQGDDSYLDCTDRNSCEDSPCDYLDRKDLHMGYSTCTDAFTLGQAERMYFYLDNQLANLWSPANLTAKGIDNVQAVYSEPEPAFSASQTLGCEGTTITFTDETLGCVETYNWIFPGGSPVSSSDPNPVVTYNLTGEYPVQLTVSNSGGYSKAITKTAHIKIANTGITPPYVEGFESSSFVPNGWKIVDEAGDGGWERKTLVASQGNASAWFPAYNSVSCNSSDFLISPLIDLTNVYTASLKFDYAYLAYSAAAEEADQMLVQIINECGETLAGALFEGSGFVLGSELTFFNSGPFEPQADQWKTIDVSLNDHLGDKIYIKFNFTSLQGQNFYLDNFVLDGFTTGVEPLLDLEAATTVIPNPFQEGFDLQFQLPQTETLRLEVIDMSGKILFQEELGKLSAGSHERKLNSPEISNLAAGVYLLNIYTETGRATKKLVKL